MKLLFVKHLCIIIVTLIGCVSRTLYAGDCIKEQTKAVLHYYQNINNYQFERANKDLKFFLVRCSMPEVFNQWARWEMEQSKEGLSSINAMSLLDQIGKMENKALSGEIRNYILGRLAEVGQEHLQAILYYQKACSKGFALACHRAGIASVAKKQYATAVDYYQKGCVGNYLNACANLGNILISHLGKEAEGTSVLDRYCRQKNSSACRNLGYYYLNNNQKNEAKKYLHLSCQMKNSKGCLLLGLMLTKIGQKEEAKKYFQSSCRLKPGYGCAHLAKEVLPRDLKAALNLFVQGCQKGSSIACASAGNIFCQQMDFPKALSYYAKSCRFQNGVGCYKYGWLLENKLSRPEEGLHHYLHSCKQQNKNGCFAAANFFKNRGWKPEAEEFFTRGCQLKDIAACKKLCQIGTQDKCDAILGQVADNCSEYLPDLIMGLKEMDFQKEERKKFCRYYVKKVIAPPESNFKTTVSCPFTFFQGLKVFTLSKNGKSHGIGFYLIKRGSFLDKLGFKSMDIILQVEGEPISMQLVENLCTHRGKLEEIINRAGKFNQIKVKVKRMFKEQEIILKGKELYQILKNGLKKDPP